MPIILGACASGAPVFVTVADVFPLRTSNAFDSGVRDVGLSVMRTGGSAESATGRLSVEVVEGAEAAINVAGSGVFCAVGEAGAESIVVVVAGVAAGVTGTGWLVGVDV
jgi:hypothetical protein